MQWNKLKLVRAFTLGEQMKEKCDGIWKRVFYQELRDGHYLWIYNTGLGEIDQLSWNILFIKNKNVTHNKMNTRKNTKFLC